MRRGWESVGNRLVTDSRTARHDDTRSGADGVPILPRRGRHRKRVPTLHGKEEDLYPKPIP